MTLLPLYIFISYFSLDCCAVLGQVLQNKTVDDNDPAIRYTGQWTKSEVVIPLDNGGIHMYTQDPNARATFEFTGVAVYFLSPLWPYNVTTQVQLDSRSPEILNLRDFSRPDAGSGWETVASDVVWSADGLPNGRHVLTMSVGAGEGWAVVDGFIVTGINGSTSTAQGTTTAQSTTTIQSITTVQSLSLPTAAPMVPITVSVSTTKTTTPNPSSTPPSSSPSKSKNALATWLPVAIGFLALVIVVLICYCLCRRQLHRRHQPQISLEEEFPFIPGSPPALSVSPWAPTSTANSPTYPETDFDPFQEQKYYTMVPLVTRQSGSTLNSSSVTASRGSIQEKPPSYDESMTTHRRARREVVRKSISVVISPD